MARVHNSRSIARKKNAARPRKQAQQERSRALVESLMRATARILIRDGYANLTTNAVAALAGVSVGSLYQYFPNKDALVSALVEQHVSGELQRFRSEAPALFALPVERALPRFVKIMLDVHRTDPELHRVFAEQLPKLGGFASMSASMDEGVALARAYLELHKEEVAPKDLDAAAFVLVHTAEALTHAAVLMRPDLLAAPALEREISACLVRYLKG
jgi:AcrR family transcriptional regulator